MSDTISPKGEYNADIFADDGFANLNADVDDPPILATLGVVDPVTMDKAAIAPGESLADFTRRMYGANTATGRALISRANDNLKGTVNVPHY
jgi:hypothetical protein